MWKCSIFIIVRRKIARKHDLQSNLRFASGCLSEHSCTTGFATTIYIKIVKFNGYNDWKFRKLRILYEMLLSDI